MRLDKLTPQQIVEGDSADIDVRGLTADSRTVQPGYLFAALAGSEADGRDYIRQALDNGAAAILTDGPMVAGVPTVASDNPRRELALMAARFFEVQPPHVACITGTNGKTSTACFLRQLLEAAGHRAASMGTLGVEAGSYYEALHHTTPEPVRLHAALRDLTAHRVTHLAMEASSHGLAQYRLDGVRVEVAGFSNLTRDHLDYHASPEDYEAAKARLFTELLAKDGTAVIVMTHDAGRRMAEACRAAGRRVLPVGRAEDPVQVGITGRSATGLDVAVQLNGTVKQTTMPLIGDFQTENIALALGLALSLGVDEAVLFEACRTLHAPRGRMQFVGRSGQGAAVYVDYAHTPDALANALAALRRHVPDGGKLAVLFGCGGDRDAGKRPAMGAAAAEAADRQYVTDDNPRRETAADIRAAIMRACPQAAEIADRRQAIGTAIADAGAQDVLLLAGKGHETGQIVGDTILPFDDVSVAHSFLTEQGGRHG